MTSETRPADRGHDYEYEEPPSDRLVCKICQLPCREAQMSECCGHVFCERDLESMKAAKTIEYACPICRIKPFNTYPNRAINREIKELRVYCPYKSDGCNWIGKVMNVDEHLKGQIPCSKCKQPVDHTTIATHITNKCPCYCQYCKMTAKKEVISNEHQEKCHKFPVPCPNDCGKNITRSNLGEHKKTCPLEIIKCNECGAEMARKDEEGHNKIFKIKHFSLIGNRLQKAYNDTADTVQTNVEVIITQAAVQIQGQISDLNVALKIKPEEYRTLFFSFWYMSVIVIVLAVLLQSLIVNNSKLDGVNDQLQQGSDHHDVSSQLSRFSEKLDGLDGQVVAVAHAQTTTYSKLTNIEQRLGFQSFEVNQFSIVQEKVGLNEQVAPVTLIMSNFSERLEDKEAWRSSSFLAFWRGYRMCLFVYAAGYCDDKGTHVSVFLALMKGPYDHELQQSSHWPARGIFTIELLNQLSDEDHHIIYVSFDDADSNTRNRVVDSDTAPNGWGIYQFISHENIYHQGNTDYTKNDTLYFRISYTDTIQNYPITPVILMYNYTEKMKSRRKWFSSPFLAFWRGYQMCLRVDVTGGNDEVTHISVYLHVMKGPYDNELEQLGHWPVRGTFTIELLNQLNDSDHITYVMFDNATVNARRRLTNGYIALYGLGTSKFIPHDLLKHENFSGYLKNDNLHFRISYMDMYQHYLVAPVTLRMFNFSEKMKHKEKWFSNSFFAFWKGYQLCLAVYAAGSGVGEGTHVSVFLYLMKGPYDDDLEQSGFWPLIGTFTIELLNQLSDHDHHVTYVEFDDIHSSDDVRKRVIDDDIAIHGFGNTKFISHDAINNQNITKFVISDALYFRISYIVANQHYDIAPVILRMHNAAEVIRNKDSWFSSPFLAFWRGYQMCLLVKVADNNPSNDDMSVYIHLMKGRYDDELEQSGHWPVRGIFTIELLNQLSDNDHYVAYVSHDIIDDKVGNRVLEDHIAESAVGERKFMSYDTLKQSSKYFNDDTLYFRISYMPVSYIAPVILKLHNFAEKIKCKEAWLSTPFFAFWRGYQMCLNVEVAGYTDEQGIYMSVYIHVMKGPYDDALEQSGHWPVRGTFTIELLNQLSDKDHHVAYVSYDNIDDTAGARVIDNDIAPVGRGKGQFMSHSQLLYQNVNAKYVVGNCLYFKISYNKEN